MVDEEQGDRRARIGRNIAVQMALILALLFSAILTSLMPCEALSVDDWINNTRMLISRGDLDNAMYCAERAIEADSSSARAWFYQGDCLNRKGRLESAVTSYNRALQINPQFQKALYFKGVALENLSRYQEAINCYDEIIEIEKRPGRPYTYYIRALENKGRALRELYRYNEAIKCYDDLIEWNDTLAWSEKGIVLAYQGRYDEAMKCFNETINRTPKNESPYVRAEVNRGIDFLFLKNPQMAVSSFDGAIKAGSGYDQIWIAWFCKGVALRHLGMDEEAKIAFNKAGDLRIEKVSKDMWLHEAIAYVNGLVDVFMRVLS